MRAPGRLGSLGAAVAAGLLCSARPAHAAYTATLSGSTATLQGSAATDDLSIARSGGLLTHNRFSAGDPGFAGDQDFDSTVPGVQPLAAGPDSVVRATTGSGRSAIRLGTPGAPASTLRARFEIRTTQGAPHSLAVDDSGNTEGVSVRIDGSEISSDQFRVDFAEAAGFPGGVALSTGAGNDVITLSSSGIPTSVSMGGGNDLLVFTDGADLGGGTVDGGTGSNTLDYMTYTTPVVVNLGDEIVLSALMSGAEATPPNRSQRIAGVTVLLNPADLSFDLRLDAVFFQVRDVLSGAIRQGGPGVTGGVVLDLGGRESWVQGGPEAHRTIVGGSFPAAALEGLLAGETYVEIQSTTFPGGEVRGQLIPISGPHSATGTGGVTNIQSAVGGLSDNMLVGSTGTDFFFGGTGGGVSEIHGRGGTDLIFGGVGLNVLAGGGGDDLVLAGAPFTRMLWFAGAEGNDGSDLLAGGPYLENIEVYGAEGPDQIDVQMRPDLGPGIAGVRGSTPSPFELLFLDADGLILSGGGGDDQISAGDGLRGNLLLGLNGGPGNDVLVGGDGHDQLDGGTGANTVLGRGGDDTLFVGPGGGQVDGGPGSNLLIVTGTSGNDQLLLLAEEFVLNGESTLYTGIGVVEAYGQAGADAIAVSPSRRTRMFVDGGDGSDSLIYYRPRGKGRTRARKGSIGTEGYLWVLFLGVETTQVRPAPTGGSN